MPTPTNRRNLIAGGPGHREGKIQRAVRRALIGATTSTVSTAAIMEMAYPTGPWPPWRWTQVCRSARRWAEPVNSNKCNSLGKQTRSDRIRAGMAKAKAAGKHIGRPSISPKLQERIVMGIAAGETAYRIAKDLSINHQTVAKYARSFEASAAA
jgi:hypothetical protein